MGNGGKSLNGNAKGLDNLTFNTNTCKEDVYEEQDIKIPVEEFYIDEKSGNAENPVSSEDFLNITKINSNVQFNSNSSKNTQDILLNEIDFDDDKNNDPLLINFNLSSHLNKSRKFPVSSFYKINEEKVFQQILDCKQEDFSSEEDTFLYKNTKKNYYQNKKYQLYKTEICRSHSEVGYCKYGAKCQFAHDYKELRQVHRHPKYKTETCKTFWEEGSCPYGKRCCFIHIKNDELKNNCLFVPASNNLYTSTRAANMEEENQNENDGCTKKINANTEKIETNFNQIYSEIDDSIECNDIFVNELIPFLIDNKKKTNCEDPTVSDRLSVSLDLKKKELVSDKQTDYSVETDENEYYNSLFIQELHPFWDSNEINMWMGDNKSLFYISGRRDEFKTR